MYTKTLKMYCWNSNVNGMPVHRAKKSTSSTTMCSASHLIQLMQRRGVKAKMNECADKRPNSNIAISLHIYQLFLHVM